MNDEHTAFHEKMLEDIIKSLTEEELEHILAALGKLNEFFNKL